MRGKSQSLFRKPIEPSCENNIIPLFCIKQGFMKGCQKHQLSVQSPLCLLKHLWLLLKTREITREEIATDTEHFITQIKKESRSVSSCQLLKYEFHLSLLQSSPTVPFPYLLIFGCYY